MFKNTFLFLLIALIILPLPFSFADDLDDMAKKVRAGQMSAEELSRVVILRAEVGELRMSNPERLVLVVPGFAETIGEALVERSAEHYRQANDKEAEILRKLSEQILGESSIYTERLVKLSTLGERLDQLRYRATKEELLAFESTLSSELEQELFLPTVRRLLKQFQKPVEKPKPVELPKTKKIIKTVETVPEMSKTGLPLLPIIALVFITVAVVSLLLIFLTPHVPFLSRLSGDSAEKLEEARQDWIKHRAKKRGVGYAEVVQEQDEYSKILEEFGLDDSATEADIKKAFRNLVKELHPDAHGSSGQVTDEEGNVDRSFDELKRNYERLLEMRKSFFGS